MAQPRPIFPGRSLEQPLHIPDSPLRQRIRIVEEDHILHPILRHELRDIPLIIPIIHHMDRLVMVYQERHEGIPIRFLDHQAGRAILQQRIFDDRIRVIPSDKAGILVAVVVLRHIRFLQN